MSWKEIPDLLAVGLLIYAFVAVTRPNGAAMTRLWLAGWICIEVHFAAFSFLDASGTWGIVAEVVGTASLVWCAQLFCWSLDPLPQSLGSRLLFWAMSAVYTLYIGLALSSLAPRPWMVGAASLFALVPLALVIATPRTRRPATRWIAVVLNVLLAQALLLWQFSTWGPDLMVVLPLFVAYIICCLQFWFSQQRHSGGFYVTLLGLLAWSCVFPLGLAFDAYLPTVRVDAEVWNLPKYLVAVGMILLLLENQLKRNQHLAQHDALTGLPNRRLFEDKLSTALARARRNHMHAALLAIDLDGFKQVNDTLGHHAGDEALQQIGSLFAACVRPTDTLARTGGDEFSVVLEGPITRDAAAQIAQSLRRQLETPLQLGGHTMQLGASIGLAMYPDDAASLELLSRLADQRMYAAKRNTRDTYDSRDRSSAVGAPDGYEQAPHELAPRA